jgi:hypothetical protein
MSAGVSASASASAVSTVIGTLTVCAFDGLLSFFNFREGILDLSKVLSDSCKVCLQVIGTRKNNLGGRGLWRSFIYRRQGAQSVCRRERHTIHHDGRHQQGAHIMQEAYSDIPTLYSSIADVGHSSSQEGRQRSCAFEEPSSGMSILSSHLHNDHPARQHT